MGQHGQGDVLEGGGGAVEQLQHIAVPHRLQGADRLAVKAGIGLVHRLAEGLGVQVRKEGAQQP